MTLWVNPKVPGIRIKVWPLLTFGWCPQLRHWGICLVHNETQEQKDMTP